MAISVSQGSAHNDYNLHNVARTTPSLAFMEGGTVYNKICMNQQPNFSPICLTGVPCPTAYTYQNSGCPCMDGCEDERPTAQVIPAYVCPSTPRVNNPFVEVNQCWECSLRYS